MNPTTPLAILASALLLLSAQEDQAAKQPARGLTVSTLVKELPGGTGGIEVDAKGFIYSSDFGSKLGAGSQGGNRIFKIDTKTGKHEIFCNQLRGASGSAIGPQGDFFQSNVGGNSVLRISPDGKLSKFCSHWESDRPLDWRNTAPESVCARSHRSTQ